MSTLEFHDDARESEERLNELLKNHRKHVHGIDVHGATFGDGSEETALCIIAFHSCAPVSDLLDVFLLDTEACEALLTALQDMLPKQKAKEEELRAVRN